MLRAAQGILSSARLCARKEGTLWGPLAGGLPCKACSVVYLDVEASTALLRASGKQQVHKGLLRSILVGGVACGHRAHKARLTT